MPRSEYHFLLFKKSFASSRIFSLIPTSSTMELKGRFGRDAINRHSFLALDEYMEMNSSFAAFQAFFASSNSWFTTLWSRARILIFQLFSIGGKAGGGEIPTSS